jgi:hypothetical protein
MGAWPDECCGFCDPWQLCVDVQKVRQMLDRAIERDMGGKMPTRTARRKLRTSKAGSPIATPSCHPASSGGPVIITRRERHVDRHRLTL